MPTIANSNAATKAEIRDIVLGPNTMVVGPGGDYATVTDAVTAINAAGTRYTVVYDTGTATLTNGTQNIVPSGGADFTGLRNATELWLYLDTAGVWLPLIGMGPHLTGTTWGDYGELKYKYEGVTGAKSYQLVTPTWYHILLLPGVTEDTSNISWPLFTTMSGVSKEGSVFRGSIGVDITEPGIWMDNFTWSSIHGVASKLEEALVTIIDDTGVTEEGYAEIVVQNLSAGRGNADRDVIYRESAARSHALFQSTNCDYYAHYDAVQCWSREVVFRGNNIFVRTQDTTVGGPTGFQWFSGGAAPETDLFIDMSHNNFFIEAPSGSRTVNAAIILQDQATYLSAPPDVYGSILNNYFRVHQLGTGDAKCISSIPFLMGANDGNVVVDGNIFDVIASGGTATHIDTHATAAFLTIGTNNIEIAGGSLSIIGAPAFTGNYGGISVIGGSTAQTGITATPVKITGFTTNLDSKKVTSDHTADTLTIGEDGVYSVEAQISFSGTDNEDFFVELYVDGVASGFGFTRKLGTGGDVGSASLRGNITLEATEVLDLRVKSNGTTVSMTVVDAQFTVTRI